MRYRTRITYVTCKKEYPPGTVLPADISEADLAFLRKKGFITPADMGEVVPDGGSETETEEPAFYEFDEKEPDALKSEQEIRKIRSKKEVISYAASIGLNMKEDAEEKSLKDLQDEVINFQEEKLEEDELEGV